MIREVVYKCNKCGKEIKFEWNFNMSIPYDVLKTRCDGSLVEIKIKCGYFVLQKGSGFLQSER